MQKANALIWVIAGIYLEYQAYGLFQGLSEVGAGTERTVMMIAIVVFVICGAVIAVSGFKRYLNMAKEEKNSAKSEEQKTESENIEENQESDSEEIIEEKQE